jgi:ABC-type ATPase involved in cell division
MSEGELFFQGGPAQYCAQRHGGVRGFSFARALGEFRRHHYGRRNIPGAPRPAVAVYTAGSRETDFGLQGWPSSALFPSPACFERTSSTTATGRPGPKRGSVNLGLTVDIKKKLGSFTLEVSLASERGSGDFGLGCGKSMTLKCIARIETPDTGEDSADRRFCSIRKKNHLRPRAPMWVTCSKLRLISQYDGGGKQRCGSQDRGKEKEKNRRDDCGLLFAGLAKKRPTRHSGGPAAGVALARLLLSSPEIHFARRAISALDSHLKLKLERGFTRRKGLKALPSW